MAKRRTVTPKNLKANGSPQGAAVAKIAIKHCDELFGDEEIPSKTTVLKVFGALMRGEFHRWRCLRELGASKKMDAICFATDKLMKVHGGYQKPSENERDRQMKVDHYVGAAFSFRDLLAEQGRPNDPDIVWDQMMQAAIRADKPTSGHLRERELSELKHEIMKIYMSAVERAARQQEEPAKWVQ